MFYHSLNKKVLYKIISVLVFAVLITGTVSCTQTDGKKKILIGFSQAMTTDEWRRQMNQSMIVEASLHPEMQLIIEYAHNNVNEQIKDIEQLITKGVDVILVSPIEEKTAGGV